MTRTKDFGINSFLWKSIKAGNTVFVRHKSQLGKSRVDQHGRLWDVKAVKGHNLLTFSVKTGYKRWISGPNDKDFIVVAVNTGEMIIGSSERTQNG